MNGTPSQRTRACPGRAVMTAAFLAGALAIPAEAQLFNGGGLFNRKTDPPRAQTEDEIGVPVPVTGRVEALKGHEVTFEIRAEAKTRASTVEFLIRTFPSAGKIVSLVSKPGDRSKAVVTYWADPESSAESDAFSFAVRYRGGRYSAEMRYDIDLVDLKTEIQVPSETDFGEVTVGAEAVREVVVRNLGNASMDRQVFLAPPWHLVDPIDGKLSLGPRGGRVLKVAFRPELAGETSYFLSLSRSKEGTTKLLGTGIEAFRIETETVELALDEASGERRGEIVLSNPGSKAVLLEARASGRLESSLLEGYVLPPGQSTTVPVKLAAADTAPFDGSVEFFMKSGYARPVRVIAPVVPGRLVVSVPDSVTSELINFGKVEAGRSLERGIVVTNRGGVAVPVEFHLPAPFQLLTKPSPQLAPLSAMNLSVGLFPAASQRGLVDVTMTVSGPDHSVPLRLLANVVAPTGAAPGKGGVSAPNLPAKGFRMGGVAARAGQEPASDDPAAIAAFDAAAMADPAIGRAIAEGAAPGIGRTADDDESDPESEGLSLETRELVGRNLDRSLRKPEDLTVLGSAKDSLTLAWTAPRGADPVGYDLEVKAMHYDEVSGTVQSLWLPYSAVKVERIDRLVKAKVSGLMPARQYEFRVLLTTEDGRSSPPSEPLLAITSLPMDWTYIYLSLGLLFLASLGYGGWRVYLARRPEVYQSQYVDV
jgi:hypothetical protein